MRIALSGGQKTINITTAIESKIQSGGDDLVTLPSIDDLIEYIDCGYKIDRVLISEQSITANGEVADVTTIRNTINGICRLLHSKEHDAKVVFFTSYNDLAEVIYDESLEVRANSIIILKDKPYSTSFFIEILTSELDKINREWVYIPHSNEEDEWETDGEEEDTTEEWEDSTEDTTESDDEAEQWDDDFDDDEFDTDEEQESNDEDTTEAWDNIGGRGLDDDGEWDDGEFGTEDEVTEEDSNDTVERIDMASIEDAIGKIEDDVQSDILDNTDDADDESTACEWYDTSDEVEPDVEHDQAGNVLEEDSDSAELDDSSNETAEQEDNWDDDEIAEENTADDSVWEDTTDEEEPVKTDDPIENVWEEPEEVKEDIAEDAWEDDDSNYANDEAYAINDSIHEEAYDDSQDQHNIDDIYKQAEEEDRSTPKVGVGFTGRASRKRRASDQMVNIDGGISVSELAHRMESFASRGNAITVLGNGGTGASSVVINMANFIASMGYSVLIVDADTLHRSQSYITKEAYNAIEAGSSDLMAAINSGAPVERFAKVVRPGVHLLSMWMGGDCVPIEDIIKQEKLTRFINSVKSSFNFTIYDIPFSTGTTFLRDVVYTADNIVNVVDASNWGVSKFMLDCCNIASEEMQETIFNRTEIIFNKFRGIDSIFGRKVKKLSDILRVMDDKVVDLTGVDSGMYFMNMHIVGKIDYDEKFDDQWFSNKWYSDDKHGKEVFSQLVAETVLY